MARFGLDGNEDIKKLSIGPLILSYNDRIRPLLDTIDSLRHLNVMKEGINLPTIVVVGDQSSGKSSVLESLAGIRLPRGQGICTRVPLIMCLKDHHSTEPELYLEYQGKLVQTYENEITAAINAATKDIAGSGKGISRTPLTLIVKKKGVPDLTMVDLPGITRVPIHGQPEDIYEQISNIIMEYIRPKDSIILNVLSASVDFPTCESIRMSQRVDNTGERTLAVVTKADMAPEGLLEKVTADAVNIGLGYVCVRNQIGDESYEEARMEEARLFESHPLLSNIDKSIVGIPMLAQKLVRIQAALISKCLPNIVKKINDKLNQYVTELNEMPRKLSTVTDAMKAFLRILGAAKESLKKLLLQGDFEEYSDEAYMHCTARMAEMLNDYSKELQSELMNYESLDEFLTEEIRVLEEAKGIALPNFLPRTAFLNLLQRKVKQIADTPVDFIHKMWSYVEDVVVRVLMLHSNAYPQLQSSTRRAALNLISKMRDRSYEHVKEIVEMEKLVDYTSNPDYKKTWASLMEQQDSFMEAILYFHKPTMINLIGFGKVEVGHLRRYTSMVEQALVEQAFDMKMRITAYWKIVTLRLVDFLALHIVFSVQKLVNQEMELEIVNELRGPHMGSIERMLQESSSITDKRERLNKSIKLLRDSMDVVANVMDRNASHGNTSLEAAVNWFVENENDLHIDQMPMVPINIKVEDAMPSLTTEEVRLKVQELRERDCKKKEEEEKGREREREKERIRQCKELLEAKQIEEENERKRILASREAEKEEEKKEREKIRQRLEEDEAERSQKLGVPPEDNVASIKPATPAVQENTTSLPVKPATKEERMRDCLRSLKHNHKDDAKVKRAFQTLLTYVGNVAKNLDEEKFRKIRLNNPSFQDRVGSLNGGIEFLELCGFEKIAGGEFLFLPRDKVDLAVLHSAGSELNSANIV